MRLASIPLLAISLVLVAGAALGATTVQQEHQTEISTDEATCQQEISCDGPSATARAGVKAPTVTADEPDVKCVTGASTDSGQVQQCQPRQPTVDDGVVTAYVGVDGIEDDGSGSVDTQGEQAAEQGGSDDGIFGLESEAAMLVGALGLGASGAAAFVGLRRFVTFLLAPLASRLKRSELLDNDTRRSIYERIQEDPGVNLRGLADELDLAWGTLLHHLHKLEDGHLITSERYGKYRRFFLNGSTYSKEEQARLAALSTPSTARVAEYILDNPGANQSEVGDAIGVTPSTVLFHVRRLKDVGLVQEEREGRYVHYYPNIEDHEAEQLAVA